MTKAEEVMESLRPPRKGDLVSFTDHNGIQHRGLVEGPNYNYSGNMWVKVDGQLHFVARFKASVLDE